MLKLRRWTFLIVNVGAAALPIACLFFRGVQIFDLSTEFVAYRIGDALRLRFHEAWDVHPVQGIPTVLLSKPIVYTLFPFYKKALLSAPALQYYSSIFFVTFFILCAMVLSTIWPRLNLFERCSAGLVALLPWYFGGVQNTLLSAPEYWFGEYIFQTCAVARIFALRRCKSVSPLGGGTVLIGESDASRDLARAVWMGAAFHWTRPEMQCGAVPDDALKQSGVEVEGTTMKLLGRTWWYGTAHGEATCKASGWRNSECRSLEGDFRPRFAAQSHVQSSRP